MKRLITIMLLAPITLYAPSKPKQEALILPYRALELGVSIESGVVKDGEILTSCTPMRESELFREHQDSFLYLNCDGGRRLKINNLIFEEGEKMPLKVIQVSRK